MGTPKWTGSERTLAALTRRTPLSEEDWNALISERIGLLKPFMDTTTLGRISDVACLYDEGLEKNLRINRPVVESEDGYDLDTQGIFFYSFGSRVTYEGQGYLPDLSTGYCRTPSGHLYLWGLTRKEPTLILCKLVWEGLPGHKQRGFEKAERLIIRRASPAEIRDCAKVELEDIWTELGKTGIAFADHRKRMWEQANDIAETIRIEHAVLEAMKR